MRIRGTKTLRRVVWQLRGRLLGGDLILGYHRVAEVGSDPWGLCVPPTAFRAQMEVLRRDFRPVPLRDLVEESATSPGSQHRPRVAVTFDDGYADVLETALPVLEDLEVPATVFIVLEGSRGSFWWDRLGGILHDAARLPARLEIPVGAHELRWSREEGAPRLGEDLYATLRGVDPAERDRALTDLSSWALSGGARVVPAPEVLSDPQIVQMDRHPLVEIGSHGATHLELRDRDAECLAREIVGSRRVLSDLLDHPVESFSYPHGILDPRSRECVVEAGYRRACASSNGLVHGGSDPFVLPRLWPSGLSPDRFRGWLRSWAGR